MRILRKGKGVAGFTLVEMAIVLVIIGIILAGVMKGRDIVRGSQVKQFSQMFVQKWQTVCQTYYDKTGQQLNDGTVNGGTANPPDGRMDGGAQTGANANTIVSAAENVGITPCTLIKSKVQDTSTACPAGQNIFATLVEGEYAGSQYVAADLVSLNVAAGTKNFIRNCVVLANIPTDVAIGLDTAIDGRASGNTGSLVSIAEYAAGTTDGGWPYAVGSAVTAQAYTSLATSPNTIQTMVLLMDF